MGMLRSQKEVTEKKIIKACAKEFRSLGDLAEILAMNKNTLRAHFLYPMVKSGQLVRSPAPPAKSTVKYKCAGA